MIKRIDNVGIAVRDVPTTVRFFEEKLGLKPSYPLAEGATSAGIDMGNGQSLFIWKSQAANSPAVGRTTDYERNPVGIDHIAMEVDDIEAASAELERRGLQFMQPIVGEKGQFRYRGFTDPDGNMLYIIQRPSQ